MANGLSRFMNFLKLTDEDDEFDDEFYDEYDDYDDRKIEREERRLKKEQRREEKRAQASEEVSYRASEKEETAPPRRQSSAFRSTSSSSSGKVVPMPSSGESEREVCIIKPANIGEAQNVCELLLDKHPVVVNLEGIDIMEAQRIMDFIAGCIFAVSGNMCQVSRYIFMFSPQDVEISGDYIKSLETEESYNIATFDKEF